MLRAYDDGVAYRLVLDCTDDVTVKNEAANFNFAGDYTAHVPFIGDILGTDIYMSAQEAHYDVQKLSVIKPDTMAYSPALVELDGEKKAVVLEADLEAYPGMFLKVNRETHRGLQGVFAPYPKREEPAAPEGGVLQTKTMIRCFADGLRVCAAPGRGRSNRADSTPPRRYRAAIPTHAFRGTVVTYFRYYSRGRKPGGCAGI